MKQNWFGVGVAATILVLALGLSGSVANAKPAINTIGSRGIAIKGFDPVAYFTQGKPVRGSKQFEVRHKGAKWRFASAQHKALFQSNPSKYVPAYGGYCAYGVSQGNLVKIEGNSWSIKGGRLYLNYNRSIQRTWSKSPARYIRAANQRFSKLLRR